MRSNTFVTLSFLAGSALGCSGTNTPGNGPPTGGRNAATGGAQSSNGGAGTGGVLTTGGVVNNGGSPGTGGNALPTGGSYSPGGSPATGGTRTAGGSTATGGSQTNGGNPPTGGASNTGGNGTPTGGSTTTGGSKPTGGASTTGGSKPIAGTSSTGGNSATGGSSVAGGATATGGTTAVGGGSGTQYCGFQPVPNAQNTANFDAAAWYASWKTKFYVDCGGGMARVANGQGSNNTVSEGIGYGMLLAVGNGDKTALDALWAYYKGNADVNGLMNWSVNGCTTGNNNAYAATDGDEDAAMALVQADAKWGGYKTDATNLINLIKKYETSAGPPSYLGPGDAANNGGKGPGIVNPSYFAPGYWHVWATYVADPFWNQLATDAYTMLAAYQTLTVSGSTGALVPDWGNSQGQNPYGSSYYYDACRTPWRVAVDYSWFCTAAAQTFLQHVSTYVDSVGGVASVPFDKNSAFLGPFALSGIAVSQATATSYLNAWLSANGDDTPYFQGSLRGLFLLLVNHNFPKGI